MFKWEVYERKSQLVVEIVKFFLEISKSFIQIFGTEWFLHSLCVLCTVICSTYEQDEKKVATNIYAAHGDAVIICHKKQMYIACLFSGIVTEPVPQRLKLLQLMNGRGLYGNLNYRWQLSNFVLNFQGMLY